MCNADATQIMIIMLLCSVLNAALCTKVSLRTTSLKCLFTVNLQFSDYLPLYACGFKMMTIMIVITIIINI